MSAEKPAKHRTLRASKRILHLTKVSLYPTPQNSVLQILLKHRTATKQFLTEKLVGRQTVSYIEFSQSLKQTITGFCITCIIGTLNHYRTVL